MANSEATATSKKVVSKQWTDQILSDYRLSRISREMSILGRREVLSGKAKFGIFGDGKELPQIAMAKQFQKGDFRSGYYRDQTFMLAIGELTVQQYFAQLYAHPDSKADPSSGGRQMNSHFATRFIDDDGNWLPQRQLKNTSADTSPTAGQMPRLLGLAQASKVYRYQEELKDRHHFSINGNEVAFGTIGDASTSEGLFWETMNAAGVMQVPMVVSVWDDGYGISVPKKFQTTKQSISKVLRGFQRTKKEPGFELYTVKAWDYEELHELYAEAVELARTEHVPVLIHVEEVTQPLGHSTSGSHERYKTEERLQWEEEYCCISQFREWILSLDIATEEELNQIDSEAKNEVLRAKNTAWNEFQKPIKSDRDELLKIFQKLDQDQPANVFDELSRQLNAKNSPFRKDVVSIARTGLRYVANSKSIARDELISWMEKMEKKNYARYNSHLTSETDKSPLNVVEVKPKYTNEFRKVDGRVVLRNNFDKLFEKYPEVLTFGEDTGQLGDVNLGLEGMQEKYGELRVCDTGIREATILGQGIGLAIRGLRPIAEIQYLDYLLYCFQVLSDDLATLRYRTAGGQAAPVIVRTRGHRLEGIWHSGSPMGMIVHGIRGIHVCVPRTLTDAAGFYNTLLQGDDPALVVEPLNVYRLKEKLPSNLGEFTVPLGVPEVVQSGSDITLVSYGSTCNLVETVLAELQEFDISAELIDIRTLLPFDRDRVILKSLKKTNRILFIDEDVPGGATAFMMQKVIDEHGGYHYLDSEPKCLTAKAHRTAYGTDGDYFSKPNAEDVFEAVYTTMHEKNPQKWPSLGI